MKRLSILIFVLLFTFCSNEETVKTEILNSMDTSKIETIEVDSIDLIKSCISNYLENDYFGSDTSFIITKWEEIDRIDALSFQFISRIEYQTENKDESMTILTDSIGEIISLLFSKDKNEYLKYYDSLGVPNFYKNRLYEKIAYLNDFDIFLESNKELEIVGCCVEDIKYEIDEKLQQFLQDNIIGYKSLNLNNINSIAWSSDLIGNDVKIFVFEKNLLKEIKNWP